MEAIVGSQMRVKRLAHLATCIALSVWTASSAVAEQRLSASDVPANTLVVFSLPASPPKSYLKEGKVIGFMVDLTREALHRAGYTADIQAFPWARAVKMSERAEGLISSFSRTPEREVLYFFSDPIYEDPVLLVTKRDANFSFSGPKDLAGRTVGLLRSTSFGAEFEGLRASFIEAPDDSAEQRLKKLLAGRIDAAIISGGLPALRFFAQSAEIKLDLLKVHNPPIVLDPNFIAIAKTYPKASEIIANINKAIASMRSDGSIKRIMAGYE